MKAILPLLMLVTVIATAEPAPVDAKTEEKITRALTEYVWKFDHPSEKNITLRFNPDGRCVSEKWTGTWTIKGPHEVEIVTEKTNLTTKLLLSPDLKKYEATHFDGKPVKGRQTGDLAKR